MLPWNVTNVSLKSIFFLFVKSRILFCVESRIKFYNRESNSYILRVLFNV